MKFAQMFTFPVSMALRQPPRLRRIFAASMAGALAVGMSGCKSGNQAAPIVGVTDSPNPNGDPADANLAPAYTGGNTGGYSNGAPTGKTRVLGQSQSFAGQSAGESYPQGYPQQGYPAQGYPQDASQGYGNGDPNAYGETEQAGEEAMAEADQPPPPLPQYDQPPAPEQNDLWTPGYWGYAQSGYYWVPGAWCAPPFYGALWTPGWWGFYGGHYGFHHGYWGPHVGYYGGINYGFGYIGTGYYGGYWRGHDFLYNRAVTNVNINQIHNVYNHEIVYNGRQYGPMPDNRVSYNGGRGGINYQPRPYELAASREPHYTPLPAQHELRISAAANRGQFAGVNNGRPAQAFAARPVGMAGAIASTPREQPFNHPGVSNAGRPGFANEGRPGQPGVAGGGFGSARPGSTPGAPPPFQQGRAGQPVVPPGQAVRGNEGIRPGTPPAQENNRQAAPTNGAREGESNRLRQAPQVGNQTPHGNPQFQGRPASPAQGQAPQPYPQRDQQRVAPQPQVQNPGRPTPEVQRPQIGQRPAPQNVRPEPQYQQRQAPQVQQPQPQQRAVPQPEQRPQVVAPRAEPVPQARPQAAPAPAPRPAPAAHPPASHDEGGGDHGHH